MPTRYGPPLLPKPEPDKPEQPAAASDARELSDYEHRVAVRTLNLLDLGFTLAQVERMRPQRLHFDWHEPERLLREGRSHEVVSWLLEPPED